MPATQHHDDGDGDNWDDPMEYRAHPASVPEESSPIRKATRPVPTRQRSSSTAFTRTASASDIPSTRSIVGLARPKLPEFRLDSLQNGNNDDDDALEHGQVWDRSKSRSPPLRLSLEGHSSRSSSSPSAHQSSSTSPDLAPRRPFKRSVTVPSRPRIPGTWGDGPEKNSPEAFPLDSVQETDVRVYCVWDAGLF
jgi:hypothetical protein